MAGLDWSDGYKKVGRKARHGRKSNPVGHGGHREKRPTPYESDRATERRRKINDLRAADLEELDFDDYESPIEPSDYEEED